MKISQFNSCSERERERESSLSSLSSLKKSFTLIELSIVLLILSLLVGSLLVGRQIVDRAKIQRIIFEFDYYEKAFHQFYDTYRTVPGNLTEKECKKYSEFTVDGTDRCTWQQGASVSIVTKINNKKLNGAYNSIRPFSSSMRMLYFAKLVEKWEGFDLPRTNTYYNQQENDRVPIEFGDGNIMLNTEINMHALFPSSSYDKKIYISFVGWKKTADNMGLKGIHNYLNFLTRNEIYNDNYFSNINDHNTIMFKYLDSAVIGPHTKTSEKAAMSSKLTSELDAKIDDGRPGSGRFLAFKTVNEDKYCYDKPSAEAHLAIYNSDTNNKYGCNIIKVMEDVK